MAGLAWLAVALAWTSVAPIAPASAATITIVNGDGPTEGFNDPTPVAPVGGNPGTTRGAQRLNVFNQAAAIWGGILPSSVPVLVRATFDPQFCSPQGAVLGAAGGNSTHMDFPGAEFPGTWYPQALANKLSGVDQSVLDDIGAAFNSDVDNATCLGSIDWYYGFDGNEGNDVELLPVVLHELGHGLGFQSYVDTNSGQLLTGSPDVFSRFIYDETLGLHWHQMDDLQRKGSAVNAGKVVWDGAATTFRAPQLLGKRDELEVYSPASSTGLYVVQAALFGPAPPAAGITTDLLDVYDGSGTTTDACQPIANAAQIAGKVAFIDAGTCSFVSKVAAAQAAGAVAVLIVSNGSGSAYPMPGNGPGITIPAVMISRDEGDLIRNDLFGGPVPITLRRSATVLAGAYDDNKVLLYTPYPIEPGSSVSHFDIGARPDLLMEPNINDGLHDGVDLTRELFEDMGWLPRLTAVDETSAPPAGLRVRSAPNPFHPATLISLELPAAGGTRADVFDLQGRLVKRLLNAWLPAGHHSTTWDGTDESGRPAASGVYFVRVTGNGLRAGHRLVKLND